MAKKTPPLNLEEEEAEKAKFAGMLKEHILTADAAIGKQKAESSEISGTLGGAMNLFEKRGGRKDAMRLAAKCSRMEPADFADFFRTFVGYGKALGVFAEDGTPAQADMVDQLEEQQKNADSIGAANVAAAKAQPKLGPEASVN